MELLAECTGCHHVAPVPTDWMGLAVLCPKCSRELFLEPDGLDPQAPLLAQAECPECGHQSWVSEELAGMSVLCPNCFREISLEIDESGSDKSEEFLAECAGCHHVAPVPAAWLGTWVRCPKCARELFVDPAEPDSEQPLLAPAECSQCGHRSWVSEELIGMSVLCPKCFTEIVLELDESELGRAEDQSKESQPASTTKTASSRDLSTSSQTEAAPAAEVAAPPAPTPPGVHSLLSDPDNALPSRRWIDPVSPITVVFSTVALVCASFDNVCVLVLPLCSGAFLVGIVAVILSRGSQSFLYAPVVGTAISAVMLFTAAMFPGVLGRAYGDYRDPPISDLTIRVVPFPAHEGDADLKSPEWVDASRAALAQGTLRVEVAGVTIAPAEVRTAGRPTLTKEKYLIVRLRIHQTRTGGNRFEGSKRTLTDNSGKEYAQPSLVLAANRTDSAASRQPMIDEVAVFEAPPDTMRFLHLEIETAAWGGKGMFQFTIPKTMIWTDPARGPRDRHSKGG